MKVPIIFPQSVKLKPLLVCFTIISVLSFIVIYMISFKSYGFSLGPSTRRFLRMKNVSPKTCSKLARRESINWNYYYYYKNPATEQGLIWCKVPKAGSTTLTKLFLKLAGSKNYNNNTRVHKLLRDFYPRLPNNVMLDKMRFSKTFVVVRDPFERLLSAYRDKLENYNRDLIFRDGYYYEHYGKFMVKPDHFGNKTNATDSPTEPVPTVNATSIRREPTWKEFVSYLIRTPVARMDEHWQPITKLCSPCSLHFNFIVKMENFDSEIQLPLRNGGITALEVGKSHMTGTANKNLIEKYFKMLTLAEVKKLYTKYKRDFLLYGYTPFKYFRMFNSKNATKNKTHGKNLLKKQ